MFENDIKPISEIEFIMAAGYYFATLYEFLPEPNELKFSDIKFVHVPHSTTTQIEIPVAGFMVPFRRITVHLDVIVLPTGKYRVGYEPVSKTFLISKETKK